MLHRNEILFLRDMKSSIENYSLEMLFVFCCNWYQIDCGVFSCNEISTSNFAGPQKIL